MLIAIDPDSKQHGCAMGEMRGGMPVATCTWTIERTTGKGYLSPHYREGLLDLIGKAKDTGSILLLEDVYLGRNPLTYRRLIEARHEIVSQARMLGELTSDVSPSTWMNALGINTRAGRESVDAEYRAFAATFAKKSGIPAPDSPHECAALGILWWGLTAMEVRK